MRMLLLLEMRRSLGWLPVVALIAVPLAIGMHVYTTDPAGDVFWYVVLLACVLSAIHHVTAGRGAREEQFVHTRPLARRDVWAVGTACWLGRVIVTVALLIAFTEAFGLIASLYTREFRMSTSVHVLPVFGSGYEMLALCVLVCCAATWPGLRSMFPSRLKDGKTITGSQGTGCLLYLVLWLSTSLLPSVRHWFEPAGASEGAPISDFGRIEFLLILGFALAALVAGFRSVIRNPALEQEARAEHAAVTYLFLAFMWTVVVVCASLLLRSLGG